MKFEKCTQENDNLLECNKLSNDILFRKYTVNENDKIFAKENQILILTENGKILDIEESSGIYKISSGTTEKIKVIEEWKDFEIRKSENEPLSIIFLNIEEIKDNKYFINEPIEYKEYNKNDVKEYYIKINGNYNFNIEDSKKFLSKVIGLRNHFSKQELLEQIRRFAVKSIEKGINELSEEYKLNIETIKTKSKELEIKLTENEFDKKLYEYGVKLTYFDIENLEFADKRKKNIFKKEKKNIFKKEKKNF